MARDDDGEAHAHYCLVFDICSLSHWVSVQCLDCGGETDRFEFLFGSAVVDRQRLIDSLEAHMPYCPDGAIFEEDDDDDP
jgi:hypothetical protein